MSILGLILAIIFFVAGVLGTILPLFPGVVLIFLGTLLYGFVEGFVNLNPWFYLAQGLLVVFVFFIDYLAQALGVKHFGGSKGAILAAIAGLLAGVILLGPLGILLGPFAFVLIWEMAHKKKPEEALRTAMGTLLGFLGGLLAKLLVEGFMIAWFFYSIWPN